RIGSAYSSMGNEELSQDFLRQSIDLYLQVRQTIATPSRTIDSGLAAVYNDLGVDHFRQGRFDKAIDAYRASLSLCEGLQERVGIARSHANLGAVFASLGKYSDAVDHLEKSLAIS